MVRGTDGGGASAGRRGVGEEVQVQSPCVWKALGVLEEEKAGP